MSIRTVPGTDVRYYLASFDKLGVERTDDPDGSMSDRIVQAIREQPVTDVFVSSHGWKGDVPAAIAQYDAWIGAMAQCAVDRADVRQRRPGFAPLVVGFHWPSQPWGDEEFTGGGSFAVTPGDAAGAGAHPLIAKLVDLYADRIADTPAARDALRTIVTAALTTGPGASTLPPAVADAYRALDAESKIGAAGPTGGPGDDRAPFDPEQRFREERDAARMPGAPSFGGGGGFDLSNLLSPLRQLSFWKMKDRARAIGESAGFGLLERAMTAAPSGRTPRFHLMGHSFGCIVVSAMAQGPGGGRVLPRPLSSLTLVQGATSLWGFCNDILSSGKPGYFRSIVERRLVAGPIVTTQSVRDTAVGRFYPLGAGVAAQVAFPAPGAARQLPKYGGLGAFGIQGPGLVLHDRPIGGASEVYDFRPGEIYNLECSAVIKDGGGPAGAHNDIAKPEVAHAMWEAVKAAP